MFLFKKIAGHFFSPLSIIIMLLVAGFLLLSYTSRKKSGKLLIAAGILVLALCSFRATADIFIRPLEAQYSPFNYDNSLISDDIPKLVVVLAGGHYAGFGIPMVKQNDIQFSGATDRRHQNIQDDSGK
ncbi:MAG: hypothetical protein JSW20_09295 [Nitrospiraceae bacterium]|nr:MAG: hypothetical protein JSW20_09295 [Nitrospiraceae bacterium]